MCVRHVLRKGVPVTTEDGEETLETDALIVKVDDPFTEPMISTLAPYGSKMFGAYVEQLLDGDDSDFDYTYHERLYHYDVEPNRNSHRRDQIYWAIDKMKCEPKTRRGIAVVCHAWDIDACHPPCLQWLQFLIRDGKLQMKVLFRSNDILLAMHANMYALVHLQKYVADQLGLPVGSYTHIVTVPHIYVKRDASELKKWV